MVQLCETIVAQHHICSTSYVLLLSTNILSDVLPMYLATIVQPVIVESLLKKKQRLQSDKGGSINYTSKLCYNSDKCVHP